MNSDTKSRLFGEIEKASRSPFLQNQNDVDFKDDLSCHAIRGFKMDLNKYLEDVDFAIKKKRVNAEIGKELNENYINLKSVMPLFEQQRLNWAYPDFRIKDKGDTNECIPKTPKEYCTCRLPNSVNEVTSTYCSTELYYHESSTDDEDIESETDVCLNNDKANDVKDNEHE